MNLASDEITIHLDSHAIRLRPTLRAAMRLERRHGFTKIVGGILAGNLTIMADLIRETANDDQGIPDIIENLGCYPLRTGIECLVQPLLSLTLQLAGYDPDANPQSESEDAKTSFAEHHRRLYQIATGWLGWTPETAWSSTPAEIIEGYNGRIDFLKALLGSNEPKQDKPDLATKARLVFAKFPTKKVQA